MQAVLRVCVLLGLVLVGTAVVSNNPDLPRGGTAIPGSYIVVFHTHVSAEEVEDHMSSLRLWMSMSDDKSVIEREYNINNAFMGFAGQFTDQLVEFERNQHQVAFVEQDQLMTAADLSPGSESCSVQKSAIWNLERVTVHTVTTPDNSYKHPTNAGADVNAYVIDTGIYVEHEDFQGRAKWGGNFANDGNDTDCNGHGTHVAGTIAGHLYGVSKHANLFAAKVLGCSGSGSNSGVIDGVQWAAKHQKESGRPGVANMSLGGGKSAALDAAVLAAIQGGLTFAVAAGNEDQNACNRSPAGLAEAITVGATELADDTGKQVDVRAYFSNYGSCVDLFAPGLSIKSDWIGSKDATNTISGTSMATPHVAGAIAVYLTDHPDASPTEIADHVIHGATADVITLACTSTECSKSPNLMLYSHCA